METGISFRELREHYQPRDPERWEETCQLVEQGRFREAQVSDDFPFLLGNVLWRRLLKAYETADFGNWRLFCNIVALRDFRQHRAVRLSLGGTLPEIIENETYEEDILKESKEDYKLSTYGKIFSVTRQMIVNDDVGAFKRIPQIQGVQAARTVAQSVFNVLNNGTTTNMDDGTPLFHADRGNYDASNALTEANLLSAIAKLEKQTDSDGTALGLKARSLIVPPDLKGTALKLTRSLTLDYGGVTSGMPAGTYNAVLAEQLQVVVSPLLTNTNGWFLAADPNQVDTIHVGFLNGRDEPDLLIEAPNSGGNFDADRRRYKVRIDVVAKAVDWRGLYAANI